MSLRAAIPLLHPPPHGGGKALASGSATLAARIPPGRLVEITTGHPASAQTTAAVACLVHAQARGETAAWVQPQGGSLYPPDLAQSGVDLDALVIVHVPTGAGAHGRFKAAEILLRSGGFGMVVLDLTAASVSDERTQDRMRASRGQRALGDAAWQSRLFALAREHGSWLLLLTPANAQLGSLIALRVEPRRVRDGHGRFAIEHLVHKDKTGLCTSLAPDVCRGPCGLL